MRFLALAAACTLALQAPARLASAQAVEDPEALIRQGVNRRHLGDNQGAYRLFMRAYSARRTAKAAAHLGSCEYEIGLWVESEAHITEALRAVGDAWIESNRAQLVLVMNNLRTVLGRLEVVGRPAGAEVEVAGRAMGTLPLEGPLRVVKGEIAVRVSAPGYRPLMRSVKVAANELAQVVVELDRAEPGEVAAGSVRPVARNPYAGAGGPGLPPDQMPSYLSDGPAASLPDWRVPAAWASAGVAALLGVGAGVGAWVSYSNVKQFNDYSGAPNTPNKRCNQRAADDGGGRCPGWLSTAETSRTLAIAAGAGAGAAAVVAIILFATTPDDGLSGRRAQNALTCGPGPGAAGGTCLWRF